MSSQQRPDTGFIQMAYAKWQAEPAVRQPDGSWKQVPPRMAIAFSIGHSVPPLGPPPPIPRPKGKEPPRPSTCILSDDERSFTFSQKDNEREMNHDEVAQARQWLQWRWAARDAVPVVAAR